MEQGISTTLRECFDRLLPIEVAEYEGDRPIPDGVQHSGPFLGVLSLEISLGDLKCVEEWIQYFLPQVAYEGSYNKDNENIYPTRLSETVKPRHGSDIGQ